MFFVCFQFFQKSNLKIQIFALAYWGRNFSFVFWKNWKNQNVLSKLTDLENGSFFPKTFDILAKIVNENQTFLHFEFSNLSFHRNFFGELSLLSIANMYRSLNSKSKKVKHRSDFHWQFLQKYQKFYKTKLQCKNSLKTGQKLTKTVSVALVVPMY